jgi:hypothetical protein
MRASEAVSRLSSQLRNSTTFTTAELASYLNHVIAALTRRLVELDEGYFNFTFTLPATSARAVHTDIFEYTLPPWVMKVVEVRQTSGTAASSSVGLGGAMPFIGKYESLGLRFNGSNVLQLKGYSLAQDFEVRVAKRPAKLTLGTLPVQTTLPTPNLSYVRIDADSSADAANYPHETLANSYANALIEITGSNARSGQYTRCIGSTHFVDEGGVRYTVLQVEPAWTVQPLAGDTYELHSEIADEHMELAVLLAANKACASRGMIDEAKVLAPQIADQYAEFQRHIPKRQLAHPQYLKQTLSPMLAAGVRSEDRLNPLWS